MNPNCKHDRNLEIFWAIYRDGEKYQVLADRYGISVARIQQIYHKYHRIYTNFRCQRQKAEYFYGGGE
jgi:Mor family transcriptional regulator